MKTVAVIGGGPAGLCTARHLIRSKIRPVVFEQQNSVGGTWVYEDVDINNPKDVFSSMYDNLRTNLPRQVMEFPDYPYPDDCPTFPHHTTVRKYIEDYAKHFELLPYLRFNTKVTLVSPSETKMNSDFIQWCVQSQNLTDNISITEEYDAVVVCNGHCSDPAYPNIEGLENFKGDIIHSHNYRRADDFKRKTVLVLGANSSGKDISLELAATCKKVYLSHRGDKIKSVLPDNVKEVCNIDHIAKDGSIVLKDGTSVVVDILMACTGYKYTFPFLGDNSGVCLEYGTVNTLYKHLFNIKFPSMCFVGLVSRVSPFPLFQQQCAYIASIFCGERLLPSTQDMYLNTKKELESKLECGVPRRFIHQLGLEQFSYNDELANLSGYAKNPEVIKHLYIYNSKIRSSNLQHYKDCSYRVLNEAEFEVLK